MNLSMNSLALSKTPNGNSMVPPRRSLSLSRSRQLSLKRLRRGSSKRCCKSKKNLRILSTTSKSQSADSTHMITSISTSTMLRPQPTSTIRSKSAWRWQGLSTKENTWLETKSKTTLAFKKCSSNSHRTPTSGRRPELGLNLTKSGSTANGKSLMPRNWMKLSNHV